MTTDISESCVSACEEELRLAKKEKAKERKRILSLSEDYRRARAAKQKAWRDANPDKVKAQQLRRTTDPVLAKSRSDYYQKNKADICTKRIGNREQLNSNLRAWRERNPLRAAFHSAKTNVAKQLGIVFVPDELCEAAALIVVVRKEIRKALAKT